MIPVELLDALKAYGLAGVAVVMVLFGWLVPRWTYKALERDRDTWRALALKLAGQNSQLLVGAEVAADGLRALADVATDASAAASDPVGRS